MKIEESISSNVIEENDTDWSAKNLTGSLSQNAAIVHNIDLRQEQIF